MFKFINVERENNIKKEKTKWNDWEWEWELGENSCETISLSWNLCMESRTYAFLPMTWY